MNAKEFYSAYLDITKEEEVIGDKTLLEIYKSGPFTAVVTEKLRKIVESIGLTSQKEYFRIDVVGWQTHYQDMKKDAARRGIELNAHFWDLKIAIEHENSRKDWTDEIMKLVHIKCPLKVVIGYNRCDDRDDGDIKKLDFVAEWMTREEAFQKGDDEEYLIILGNSIGRHGESYQKFDYRGYLFDRSSQRFKPI